MFLQIQVKLLYFFLAQIVLSSNQYNNVWRYVDVITNTFGTLLYVYTGILTSDTSLSNRVPETA